MADRSNRSLKKLIFNDKYLIIVAIILAIVVWTVTSLNIGTDQTKTINIEVPIKLSDDFSKQVGMKYYTLQKTVNLSVTVTGPKFVVGQIKKDDIGVKFDTSNVNKAGEQSIPLVVSNKSKTLDFNISNYSPSSIDAIFDVEETKTFDVYLKYDMNNTAKGYVFGTPVLSEDKVNIVGPKSYVDKIERVLIDLDFGDKTELTEAFNTEAPLQIEGRGVEASYLKITSRTDSTETIKTVSVTVPVLKEVSLPVVVNFEDEPSYFTENRFNVRYSVNKINAGVLDGTDVSSAVIGTIDFSSVNTGINKFSFDTSEIQGVTLLDESIKTIEVSLTVPDNYVKKTVYLNDDDISITGLKNGEKADITSLSARYITVIVPEENKDDDITLKAKCDVSDRNDDNKYNLNFSLSNKNAWVYRTYKAEIVITK